MSKLGSESTVFCQAPQVQAALTHVLSRYLPLHLRHTRLQASEVYAVLAYASLRQTSMETACQTLAAAPSGNRLREVVQAALPPRQVLQRQLNTVLRAQLPKVFFQRKRSYALALDITLLPYYGQPDATPGEVLRAQAKAGTHYFHGYATVSIVHHRQRYVLALRFLRPQETMAAIVGDLLARVRRLGIAIRRLYLDREFYSLAVFRTLDRRRLSYVIALPIKGRHKGLRQLCQGRRSYVTTYTLRSTRAGRYTIQVALVRRTRRGRRPARWFAYAVARLPSKATPQRIVAWYRQRFGIETSYRQMNQVRARTTSRRSTLRLLLVGLAFVLVNLYIIWRRPHPKRSGQTPLTLPQLALAFAAHLEKHFAAKGAAHGVRSFS